jgi:hypothetical protein
MLRWHASDLTKEFSRGCCLIIGQHDDVEQNKRDSSVTTFNNHRPSMKRVKDPGRITPSQRARQSHTDRRRDIDLSRTRTDWKIHVFSF